MTRDLATMIRSYLDDKEIGLWPGDTKRETSTNTWCYGLSGAHVDVPAAVAALEDVHRELSRRWAAHSAGGTFYAWYDEQAGQLRCSLSSHPPDRLPFARCRPTTDASEVLIQAAGDATPGHIPWDELVVVDLADFDAATEREVEWHDEGPSQVVWAAPLVSTRSS